MTDKTACERDTNIMIKLQKKKTTSERDTNIKIKLQKKTTGAQPFPEFASSGGLHWLLKL